MMIDVDWRQPFIDYLSEQKVPSDKNLAEQLIRRAKSYVLIGDKLYKRGTSSGVLMKCVPREEGKGILEEIHKGVCGNHASSRTLVNKAFRRAFYWPTALGDAEELIRRCQGCQYFTKQQHTSAYKLVTIPPTWPFACWRLDMIGPLPTAPGGFNKVPVAIDKFTKWIEVKPVTCPKADRVLNFLDEQVHCYGLPHRIIIDLGSNFNNDQFWEYCENSGINVDMSQLPILGPMDKSSMPMGRYSTLSRSDCMTLLTQKEASRSRNYPMRYGDYVLNPRSQRDNRHTS
jgi:hypothetical protein